MKKAFIPSVQSDVGSQLGKILATLPDDLENRPREHLRKQGDLSRIVTEALESIHAQRDPDRGNMRVRVFASLISAFRGGEEIWFKTAKLGQRDLSIRHK